MDSSISELLESDRPSQRALAVDRLRKEATPADVKAIRAAMHAEPVPLLRRQLSQILRSLERDVSTAADPPSGGTVADIRRFEEDFVHWMRHELEPGIGWLELSASDEIDNFQDSETRLAIEGLAKRLDSVEALVRASAPPRYEVLSLSEVVAEAVRISGAPHSRLLIDTPVDADDNITTAPHLFRLLLSNATRNAVEAVLEVPDGDSPVYVTAGVTPEAFWVKVSNQFVGSEFSLDDVSGTGVSAKIGHQGQGFGIMRIVAKRLGYDVSMQAEAGLAVFTLRGRRNNG